MIERLQSSVSDFATRLSETIAWCSGQRLECNPEESHEIQRRRKLGEEAAKLSGCAWLVPTYNPLKYILQRRSRRLFGKARLGSIPPPLAEQLRAKILDPGWHTDPDRKMFPSDRPAQVVIVEAVVSKRAEELRKSGHYPSAIDTGPNGGKLLLYAPDENLFDGAAEYSSKGLFDVDNIPPWDTWVCFFGEYIVSWVPPQLLDLANAGINVNPEQCVLCFPES